MLLTELYTNKNELKQWCHGIHVTMSNITFWCMLIIVYSIFYNSFLCYFVVWIPRVMLHELLYSQSLPRRVFTQCSGKPFMCQYIVSGFHSNVCLYIIELKTQDNDLFRLQLKTWERLMFVIFYNKIVEIPNADFIKFITRESQDYADGIWIYKVLCSAV